MGYLKFALIPLGLLGIAGMVLCIRKCKKGCCSMGCCKDK